MHGNWRNHRVIRIVTRIWIGLLMTGLTLPGVLLIRRLAAPNLDGWLPIAIMALLGEALLFLMAARSSAPRHSAPGPGSTAQPDPLGIDSRWLLQALPPAATALVLFFVALIRA